MTLKDAKNNIKKYGLYDAIDDLKGYTGADYSRLLEAIYRVLDNIDEDALKKAIKKATR